MTAHLGARVSALLDGQLPAEEAERAWSHVYSCYPCRDLVEREGWVKSRLARLSGGHEQHSPGAPDALKGALAGMSPADALVGSGCPVAAPAPRRTARVAGLAALGGGAVGAAVVGVLALGTAPADTPTITITRTPVSSTVTPSGSPTPTPVSVSGGRRPSGVGVLTVPGG